MDEYGGRSLSATPTWAFATVLTILVGFGFSIHSCLKRFMKWLDSTKRKPLLAAMEKIKDELMLFGFLSLLMGHWIIYVAKICVKSSDLSTRRFYPCQPGKAVGKISFLLNPTVLLRADSLNSSSSSEPGGDEYQKFCPQGYESFASRESLEQLHRLLFVLGITHVLYSFMALALAVIKIYSWKTWENHAKSSAIQNSLDSQKANGGMIRLSSFVSNHTSHPWSQHRIFVWLLCFSRQFWSSINRSDYMALRLGFITTHQLPMTYDFHKYMIRSMEEEFKDSVGISVPLWIFTILCVILGFHGTNIYFWLSFVPAILILVIGTKLHRVVVKLAVESTDEDPQSGFQKFNLRDELFWFGKPQLLLRVIQFITFQNAFEVATYIWSMWEIKGPSCFSGNRSFIVIRLTFGVASQIWCSFITFPLYVIVAQMGSNYKKSIVSENVRKSLNGWRRQARSQHEGGYGALVKQASTSSSDSRLAKEKSKRDDRDDSMDDGSTNSNSDSGFRRFEGDGSSDELPTMQSGQVSVSPSDEHNQIFHLSRSNCVHSGICDCQSYKNESNDAHIET